MSMKLLVPIATYPDACPKSGLGNLYGLSAMLGFQITAMIHEVDIPPVHSALGEVLLRVSEMVAEAEALSRARAAELGSWSSKRCESLGVEISVQLVRCRPEEFADRLLPTARSHDLTAIILDGSDPRRRQEAETLIFASGGPVLVCPVEKAWVPVAEERAASFKVMVAWDGSRGAARALRDSLPLLERADTVWIFTVDDDKPIAPDGVAGAQAFLQHHGVLSRHLLQTRGTTPIGDALQAAALEHGADMLVMGAYGRSRIQEFILGGATRSILRDPKLPVLLSH